MRKTLYISDLDGTLLNSDKQISRFTASTLSALIDAVCFFIRNGALECYIVKANRRYLR